MMGRNDTTAGSPADRPPPSRGYAGDLAVEAEWDRRYSDQDRMWSGSPSGALVAEVAGLTPGRVLDVGCGEGAYAVWLARGGWDVTALEVSGVALRGFDPADYVWPSMVAALFDDDWDVEADEQRPRVAPESGAGAHHVDDVVLRARRLR